MSVPKLRFKRDDGAEFPEWENEYLNKCATFHSGLTYSPDDVTKDNSGVLVIRSTNIQNGTLIYNNNVYVNVELPKKLKLQLNDTVMCVRNGSKALVGKNALIKHCDLDKTWGAFMTVIRENESNCFIHHYLNSPYFKRQMDINAGTSTINQITSAMLNECKLSIPTDTEEQKKIADFLSNVDEVIAQSEAEVKNLEQQKKGAMQKIFSQEVRFKRDNGAEFPKWEEKKLGEITEKVNRIADNNSTAPVMMISQGNGFIYQSEKYFRDNAGQSLSKYTLLKYGEMAYNHGASKAKPYGVAYCLQEEKNARVPFVYHCFNIVNGIPKYWDYALNTSQMDRQLKKMVSSGVRMDGLLNISYDTYMQTKISVPCTEEQQKIADFLSAYDEAITYAKQELEKWKELKKGLLQQMLV